MGVGSMVACKRQKKGKKAWIRNKLSA
jgi:hypothetical protein